MRKIIILALFVFTSNIFSQDIYKDLQLYLPMNCNVLDSSGNNITTNLSGNPTCIEGRQLEALKFNGVDDYISIPKSFSYQIISENGFSWSVWIRSDALPTSNQNGRAETIISAASPLDAEDIYLGFGSLSSPRNEISFIVDGPGGAGSSAGGNNAILSWKPNGNFLNDEWYHIVGTRNYSNGKVELFVNGVKVDSATFPLSVSAFQKELEVSIARFSDGQSDIGSYFGGDIDEVRIYDRVITEQEILILYSARPEQLEIETDVFDFSNIQCRVDSVILVDILNIGPSDFIISDFELKNGTEFSLLNSGEVFLENQEVYSLGIRFEPEFEGQFYDTLFINNNFGVQPLIVYLSGSKEVKINVIDTLKIPELVECMNQEFTSNTFYIYNENIDDGLEIENIMMSPNFYTSNTFSRIEKGDSIPITIFFDPVDLGEIEEIATINFTNCNQSRTITLKAKYTELESIFESELNFGNQENNIPKSNTFSFDNTGSTNIIIKDLYFTGNNPQFNLITNPSIFDLELLPGKNANFEIGFLPTGGVTSDTMYIQTTSLCGDEIYEVPLRGKGVYRANLSINFNELSANLGDKLIVPIQIIDNGDLELSEIDSLEIEFTVNATSIILENEDYVTRDAFYKNYKKLIKIDNTLNSQNVDLFETEIALGNSSNPEFFISNVTALDGLLSYKTNQGNIEILDICESGEINRLFMSSFWFSVDEPAPNPTSGEVSLNFELIEKGQTDILLFDYQGNLVEVLFSNSVLPGKYTSKFDLSNHKDGVYFINVITPSHNLNKKLIISK